MNKIVYDRKKLARKIDLLRMELYHLASTHGIHNKMTVEISKKLDIHILEYQKQYVS